MIATKLSDTQYVVKNGDAVVAYINYHITVRGRGWKVNPWSASHRPSRTLSETAHDSARKYFGTGKVEFILEGGK